MMAVIDAGLSGLAHLQPSFDLIEVTILAEAGSCLLEEEGNISFNALSSDVQYPFIVAFSGLITAFPAADYQFDPVVQLPVKVYGCQ